MTAAAIAAGGVVLLLAGVFIGYRLGMRDAVIAFTTQLLDPTERETHHE